MPALLIGGLWLVLIVCLLSRLVRQAQAHRASALEPLPAAAPAPPDVAVILPVRDEVANIEACLAGLLAQQGLGRGYEIVVVDDNSGDG
ncbi:MAG TPA: glycosyltransferase, partial [Stellaceae bacterium]|nr:glycosyltransferase [Stellaceae bacterium]